MFEHGFIGLIKAGGFTILFIGFCSVVVLAITVERVAALWRFVDRAKNLAETVKRCLYRGAIAEARTACERSTSPAADLFLVGFERHGRSEPAAVESAVERERVRVSMALKGQLWILGTIGATAPFIGLFGTVWGIMRAFNEIGIQKKAGIDVVGPGISEALITTAFGIVVGIEAVMVYNYFQARLGRTAMELKLMAEEFVELLCERPGKTANKEDGAQAGG
ncbi:MAG: MotA/TolQ/ExbB proton channel family protein [Myxococcales bacterium]|nr:MotA/TolQ/ExbB proton channel family protein [Myxococcales bacterium]